MARMKSSGVRNRLFRLAGDRVDIATGVILALLWQAKASAAEADPGFNRLAAAPSDPALLPGEALLVQAIDHNPGTSLSLDELRTLLSPEELVRLGLDPVPFDDLLGSNPQAAMRQLDTAFRGKIKLVAAHGGARASGADMGAAAKMVTSDDTGAGVGSDGGGSGILYVLGGLLGAGGIGAAASGGGGGSSAPAVAITPTNAVPVAANDTATTAEDTPVTIDVRSNDSDGNGDALVVTAINGAAIAIAAPVNTTGGTISLGSDGRLTFTPAANFNGPVSFTYTVSDGKGGSATATVNLTVAPVNDAPVNAGPLATAAVAATAVAISGLAIADVDSGAGVISTTLVAGHGQLFAASVTGGATIDTSGGPSTIILTGTVAQVNASLAAITYRANTGFAGSDTLTMTTSDGVASDVDSFAITVTAVQSGVLSDGYIAGGTVFLDVNDNGRFDDGEPTAQTDGNGHFSLVTNATGTIIAFGGINSDTGLPNLITMRAVAGSTVVNPLTTLVEQLVENGATMAAANAAVAAAFGLPAGIDFGSFDILASTDPVLGLAAQKAATAVATLLTMARGAADTGSADAAEQAVLGKIATLLHGGVVDLADTATLEHLFSDIPGIPAGAVAALSLAAASFNQAVAAATSIGGLADAVEALSQPGANLAPVTGADRAGTGIGAAVRIDVLANDRDPNGDALHIAAIGGTAIAIDQPVAIDGGSVALNSDGSLTFTPNAALIGTPHFSYTVSDGHGGVASGDVDIIVAPTGTTVAIAAGDIPAFADHGAAIAAAGVATLDIIGDTGHLSDAQATALIGAGLDFADADHVTVEAQGTHMATSLKGLQDLHVDAVAVATGLTLLSLDAGAAGLGGLTADHLPSFTLAQSDASLDVTLNVASGQLAGSLDLSALAPALADAGIDHIGVTGGGLTVSTAQAGALAAAGIDFVGSADITARVAAGDLASFASHAAQFAAIGVDHIDTGTGNVIISDADANLLVGAGIDFAEADHVGVEAQGTHLATTLKGLQDLHIDTVAVHAGVGVLSVDAGAAGLGGIAAAGLPDFAAAQSNPSLDVTLNIAAGTIDPATDLGALAPALGAAGIDHIGTADGGALSLSFAQASALTGSGVDFAATADVTVNATALQAHDAAALGALHVDHIDVIGDAVSISDSEAGQFVAAGIDFAEADAVNVEAHGTHMSTTLKGLQDLHVDTVAVEPGVHLLTVAAGDLTALAATGLPQLEDVVDVTLGVSASDLGELPRLAEALRAAGVDHIAIDVPLDSLGDDITAMLDTITTATGIDFVHVPPVEPTLYSTLMAELQSEPLPGNHVELTDAAAAAIVESGAFEIYLADSVSVDATAAGDKPLTTLKSIADLNVDTVHLADQHDLPVYIDLGLSADGAAVGELQSLFATLEGSSGYQRIFDGSDHVALVVDAQTADQLAGVDGALDHLAQLGFTEIDVLAGSTATLLAGNGPIEVKIIGEDSDLYEYLHHGR